MFGKGKKGEVEKAKESLYNLGGGLSNRDEEIEEVLKTGKNKGCLFLIIPFLLGTAGLLTFYGTKLIS